MIRIMIPYRLIGKIALMLSLFHHGATGQGISNQTNIFIPDQLEIHIDGTLDNGGFIQNQGIISVTEDWLNTNVYQGLGTINLIGTADQRFSNNTNPVYNLVVAGGGDKRIAGTFTITKGLQLKSGIVTVTDTDGLILADGITLTGGSATSYVDGALIHEGSGYKFFPIGKNGGYYPAELLDIKGGAVVTEMEVFDDVSKITVPSNYKTFSNVYWQRRTLSGTFVGSSMSLAYSIPDNYTDTHTLDILQALDNNATFNALGQISIDYQSGIDKISTGRPVTGSIFVIGELTTPVTNPGVGMFYLSTSLSPAASDPNNRVIKVFGNEITDRDFHFIVYNRWGLKVFETFSLSDMSNRGWDGQQTAGGEYLPSGAYPFLLKATTQTGEALEKKGAINIIR